MDKETRQQIWEHSELKQMCEGDGWKIVRQRLINKIIQLSDIMELDETEPEKLSFQLAVNKQAISILINWLRDIEGEKASTNVADILKVEKTESYLKIIN